METLHPEYVLDENQSPKAVLLPASSRTSPLF